MTPKAMPLIFRNLRKAPHFGLRAGSHASSAWYIRHCLEKVPKPDDSRCRSIVSTLIELLFIVLRLASETAQPKAAA